MPFPDGVIESFWNDWVAMKNDGVKEEGFDCDIGMMFVFDFGTEYREWPFFDEQQFYEMQPEMTDNVEDPLLAVMSFPNDRLVITHSIAGLMAKLGPPKWAAIFTDGYMLKGERDQLGEPARGDLEQAFEAGDDRINEVLSVSAVHSDGDQLVWHQVYKRSDHDIVLTEMDKGMPRSGWMVTLLERIVQLRNDDPVEVLTMLAGGDREQVVTAIEQFRKE